MLKNTILAICSFICLNAAAQNITTIAGTGFAGFTSDGIAATTSGVYNPYDVGIDSIGNIYIGDVGNNRIRKINSAGVISTVAGSGTAGYNGDGIPATTAHLNFPYGMSVNKLGGVVISDMNNNRVRAIQTVESGGLIYTIAGTGVAGYSGDGGPASAAQVNKPQGIFWDLASNVYFSDAWNNRVRKISASGIITTIGGNGTTLSGGDGGPATAAGIYHPSGIVADTAGNIYVAEMMGHRIRKISTTGVITTVAGTGTMGYSGDGGPATLANIRAPKGVAIDRLGNILFADTDNQLIRKVDITTGIITTIVGTAGSAGYAGDGGPATLAKLNFHQGIFVDKYGHLYIGDCLNNRVRKIACVPPTVAPITGLDTVCVGGGITLSSGTAGGVWATSGSHASISGLGVVTGVSVGIDTVKYSVLNSCTFTTVTRPVYVKACTTTAVSNQQHHIVRIYPNPATDEIVITNSSKIKKLEICNIAGQVVHEAAADNAKVFVNVAHLPSGDYVVKINGIPAAKFVKQ